MSPGAKNEHVFIVLSGTLNVHVGSPKAPVLATMDSGACVGEMSIIEDLDPSAFVIGAEDSHLLAIHQSVLWEMIDASHEFAKNLLIVLSERVRSHNRIIADGYGELLKYERHAKTDALTSLANRQTVCGTTDDGSDSLIRIPIKISLGVAELAPQGTLDSLIRAADAALYRAKHAGRNIVSD